jgi:hypothetical protein
MKTLTKPNLAVGAAILGGAVVIAAFWLVGPAHAEMPGAAAAGKCSAERVVDNRPHPEIDIKLLVHRPDVAPRVVRLDV